MSFIGPQLPPGHGTGNTRRQHPERKQALLEQGAGHAASPAAAWPVQAQRDYELQANWQRSLGIGVGLNNLGNSCYMNSVLQCLAYLPPLANICLQRGHSRGCSLQAGSCAACMLETQIIRCLTTSGRADTPHSIHRNLHLFSRSFQPGRQEDAHELLRCMVESLESDLLRAEGRYNPSRPLRNPDTVVNHLFQGLLRSQVKCEACGHESNTYDPFMDLSLEVKGCESLRTALDRFTQAERLDGANKYRCERCKQLVAARKQMTIHDDPNVLVVHLKRFDGIFGGKISRPVAFDAVLPLKDYCSAECQQRWPHGRPCVYRLHGVLVHQGASANSGHYYAYVRDASTAGQQGGWHCMNDSSVQPANLQSVLKVSAYMLFYVRYTTKLPLPVPPVSEEQPAQQQAAGQNVHAAVAPAAGQDEEEEQQGAGFIGPALPPAKRQRTSMEQAAGAGAPASSAPASSAPGHHGNGSLGNGHHAPTAASPRPPPMTAAAGAAGDPLASLRSSLAGANKPGVTRVGAALRHQPGLQQRGTSRAAGAAGIDASALNHSRNTFMRHEQQEQQQPAAAPAAASNGTLHVPPARIAPADSMPQPQQAKQAGTSAQHSQPRQQQQEQQKQEQQQEQREQQQALHSIKKRSREEVQAELEAAWAAPEFQERKAAVAAKVKQVLLAGLRRSAQYAPMLRRAVQQRLSHGSSWQEAKEGTKAEQRSVPPDAVQQAVDLLKELYGILPPGS